jgi:hypothetical protein
MKTTVDHFTLARILLALCFTKGCITSYTSSTPQMAQIMTDTVETKKTHTYPANDREGINPKIEEEPMTLENLYQCNLGIGLRKETREILIDFKDYPGFVMTANYQLALDTFPILDGWIRTIGGPSLESLRRKTERAANAGLGYEGISYGLETSTSTPVEEWNNLIHSTSAAREIANKADKLLILGPGLKLMTQNAADYPAMAAYTDIWMIQTQRLQIHGPGEIYRREVEKITEKIRKGNPNVQIWAQITFLPGQQPDAEEWLAFHHSIADIVNGTYVGVYTWEEEKSDLLIETIRTIFISVCGQTGD